MAGRKPSVPNSEVLHLIKVAPAPVVTATELNENLDMTRQGANSRLNALEEEGYLRSKKVGAAARVYWITEKGEEIVADEYF